MFGHVQPNLVDLAEDAKKRYKATYCGLCYTLGQRYGFHSRFCLTYDLTFLILLLSSLYEPEEQKKEGRCLSKPVHKHQFVYNSFTEYAADMTIALAYHKCMDDWNDEHKVTSKGYASLLEPDYKKVKSKWPEKCEAIEKCLKKLVIIENEKDPNPDKAANCFGELMGNLFAWQHDHWENHLCELGFHLGKYIFMADAAIDFSEDHKKGNYNPLEKLTSAPEELRTILIVILGGASEAFEYLPLVQDVDLLRNIMYSGIWIKYNRGISNEGEKCLNGE